MTSTRILLASIAASFAVGAQAEVVVIVSAKSPVASVTADQVSQIYTGASTSLPGGGTATPLDREEGAAVREEFNSKVVGKSSQQLKALWSRLIFSGKGTRPRQMASAAEMKKAVAADPNAIGFIEKSELDNTVKAVLEAK